MVSLEKRQRASHYKWGKRLPMPEHVELTQKEWNDLTARQRYELRYPEKATAQKEAQHHKDNLRLSFGITPEDYYKMFYKQNGLCAICGKPESAKRRGKTVRLAVDHDHETNIIRGLLCTKCNLMIGYAKDNITILASAIRYLEDYL